MNTRVQNANTHRSPDTFGSFFGGLLLAFLGGSLIFSFGLAVLVNLPYYRDSVMMGTFLVFFAGGCLLLRKGADLCRRYRFQKRMRAMMQGKQREQLSTLAQVAKRDVTSLVHGLRVLGVNGCFPGSYVDLNRQEFVVDPTGPQPPIMYGDVQLREKPKRSVAPIYAIAVVFLLYALAFPLYRMTDFTIAVILAVLTSMVVARLSSKRTVIVKETRREEPPQPAEEINTGNDELNEVLNTAMEHMNELTALNSAIANPAINQPLQEMIQISRQIFDYIQKTPEKIRQIRQFMNYYLPTSVRLIKSYEELSRERVKGENIQETMTKIEDAMQTIRKAFQKELDDLYKDKAMDISVDIEVLKNMMEQQGLDGDILQMFKKEA